MNDKAGFTSSANPKLSALRILDKAQFIKIISIQFARDHGVILKSAEALRVHRNTLGRWVEKYPELRAALEKVRHSLLPTKEE